MIKHTKMKQAITKNLRQLSLILAMATVSPFIALSQHPITSWVPDTIIAGQHTLTLDDVTFNENTGTITRYSSKYIDIIIPPSFNVAGEDISVTAIGSQVFRLKNLTDVIIPNSVTSIGVASFQSNYLTDVTIPKTITSIGGAAFNGNGLTQVNGEASNGIIYARNNDGTDDSTTIASYGGVAVDIDFIPYGVTTILYGAFYDNKLTKIILPSSVTTIGDVAFYKNRLTEITIPQSVSSIGSATFRRNRLTSLTIPKNITLIGEEAFESNNLTKLTIPNGVISIGSEAFAYNSLSDVIFEENSRIRAIGFSAFNANTYLDAIVLPVNTNPNYSGYKDSEGNSYNAGDTISQFWTAYYSQDPLHTLTLDDVEFDVSTGTITKYLTAYIHIIIPESFRVNSKDVIISSIGEKAFYSHTLRSVTLPSSITTIKNLAFSYNRLSKIFIPNSVTTIGVYAFSNNFLSEIALPNPAVREDYTFKAWQNSSGEVVSEITDFSVSYDALFIDTKTGLKNTKTSLINIYPNPVSKVLHIDCNIEYNTFQLINLNGTVLQIINCAGQSSLQVNMSKITPGIYIVKLQGIKGTTTKRIVKK